jgi:hypothetical protein
MDGSKSIEIAGVEATAEERAPVVDRLPLVVEELQAENRALRDEINGLKGLPRRLYRPEENLPEAGRILPALPLGSHARRA